MWALGAKKNKIASVASASHKKKFFAGLGRKPKIGLAGGARCLCLSFVERNGASEVCARRPSARFILEKALLWSGMERVKFARAVPQRGSFWRAL